MFHKSDMINSALNKLFGHHGQRYSPLNLPALSLLKKIYRKKSMEYHPDRASILGMDEATCTEEFKKLSDAYRLLLPFIRQYKPRFYYSPSSAARRPNPMQNDFRNPSGYRMRFCQFLRRKKIINFNTVVDALCWQMKHRPRVGDIARRKKLLTHKQLLVIFSHRKLGEKFLETACRMQLITDADSAMILAEQKKHNIPIGRYFVKTGIISEKELASFLMEFEKTVNPNNN